jgi:UDP-glucose 4-epimerase
METEHNTKQQLALVTGGAGFVGSHLCERLVAEGYAVISLDNYFTGTRDNHVAGVQYREGHTKDIATYIAETPDIIFHLGEYSRIAPSLTEPEKVWDMNTTGTCAVLEFWRHAECKLVYAGSSTKFTADERSATVTGPDRAPYNFSKAMNSELVHNYSHWYDLDYSIAYFYNVYGPRERAGQFDGAYGTVVETFRQCALSDSKVCQINGTGEQTRAFTHVSDTVDALLLIAQKGSRDEYAISAAEIHSLNELKDMFGLEAEYHAPTKSTRSTGAEDTTKLQSLGWQQQQRLQQYIDESIK